MGLRAMFEQQFRRWLENRGYAVGTVNSYVTAINRISRHYSENIGSEVDIYTVTDPNKISEISHDYNNAGRFSEFGASNHNTYRSAISRYSEFFVNRDINIEQQKEGVEDIDNDFPVEQREEEALTNFAYERDLQTALCAQISELFPAYRIYGEFNEGIEYAIERRRIDVLLEHTDSGDLLVVELKSGMADYKTFGQISMYLGLIKNEFPDKSVSGVIVAGTIDESLRQACEITDKIKLKIYRMTVELEDA